MEETSSDSGPFDASKVLSNVVNVGKTRPVIGFKPDDIYYDMTGEKYLLIFNHETFQETIYFNNNKPTDRKGTDRDVQSLKDVFGKLGFKVMTHHNKTRQEIFDISKDITKQDHSKTSCFCVAVLTHGHKGFVYAADMPYQFQDITTLFETGHETLVGKPKLFFVQACRGHKLDAGRTVHLDGDDFMVIPSHADFLVLYSTALDYISFRDVRGSWMIQSLCDVLSSHHETLDLLQIITLVNRKVAFEYDSFTPKKAATHNKKQMTEASFTLTKFFKF